MILLSINISICLHKNKIPNIPSIKEIKNKVEEIDESEDLLRPTLKKTKYPEGEDTINKNIKDLLPLTKAIQGLDIDQINRMINNLNNIIEKF
jgi:hypothetical protein